MYILTSSDNNYIQHLGVALVSMLENLKGKKPAEVAVINDNLSTENILKFESSLARYNVPIRFIEFNNITFSGLKPKNKKTAAAFHRIFISEFYPQEVEKVLYLDCDIIVRKDISELYETDISDYIIGAVQNDGLFYQDILGMPSGKMFFNSGVMLVNLKRWREYEVEDKLIEYIKNNFSRMLRNDQDALNAVLFNYWLSLSPAWNTHLYFFTSPHLCNYETLLLKNILKDPAIVHFTTQNKPWHFTSSHPFKNEYYKYLRLTSWKGYSPPDKTLRNIYELKLAAITGFNKRGLKAIKRLVKSSFYING